MQSLSEDPRFAVGMFPAERRHPFLPYRRADDNIFYPALIDFTLSPLRKLMTHRERKILGPMLAGIRNNYPAYESLRQPGLYNFYRTNPPAPYPNGYLLRRFPHFRLAEDADDTVMISAVLPGVTPERVRFVREELVRFSNLGGKKLRHSLPGYSTIPAHGVWFGSGAMPVEVDVCVLCNILYFTAKKGGNFNATDRASFAFLRRAIERGDVDRHPFALSYYYPDPAVIWYHLARLWSGLTKPEQWLPRAEIVAGMERCLARTEGVVPRIMLHSALLKLGPRPQVLKWDEEAMEEATRSYPFFVAPLLAGTGVPWVNRLAAKRVFQVDYVCAAYYYALALEYEILRRALPSPPA